MTAIRKVAAGRAWHTKYDPATRTNLSWLPLNTSRVHLTDGTPYSRTGRNVKALCGATVWPNEVPDDHPARVCAECRRRADGPLYQSQNPRCDYCGHTVYTTSKTPTQNGEVFHRICWREMGDDSLATRHDVAEGGR